MCGRYRLSRRKQIVAEHFEVADDDEDWTPRYNIAPTQPVPVIRQTPNRSRELASLRWGLIPAWATDLSIGAKTINARAETITSTASFRDAFRSQRCLIPADGFYEWQRTGKVKQPYCFEVDKGKLFAFAGLWDRWIDPQRRTIESCTILTTTPNPMLADLHDRMPVILPPEKYNAWLDVSQEVKKALELLVPFMGAMSRYPVSTRLNQVQNEDVECAREVKLEAPPQGELFA
jgi:putative SOS response-associated peptidase YedK